MKEQISDKSFRFAQGYPEQRDEQLILASANSRAMRFLAKCMQLCLKSNLTALKH